MLALALVVLGPALMAHAQTVSPPELRAGTLDTAHRIDGRLDEATWASAGVIDAFTQADPREGAPASARTTVRVLAGPKALVIGIDCEQPAGVGVVSFNVRRDAALTQEDHVRLVLGPFMDGRSGYVFALNPSGARYDGIINPGGENDNAEWDGIWDAVTTRRDGGWTAEVWIPFLTLSDRSLGLGGAAVPGDPNQPRRAAHEPAARRPRSGPEREARREGRRRHASTDCAETEVDTRRTNLTRFPLFFPEKRTFFLEGDDIFAFGLGLDQDVLPYFSRRIGLVAGSEVPILAGGKVNGRIGNTNVGALAVGGDFT